jgi:formylglycine-generating enzyme required for sulfatase activity
MGIAGTLYDAADITAPVNSYWPNKFGLYNVCGNVAEMVSEKGISRGGGWKNAGGDVKIESKRNYTKSATDLGFRYFMEIIEI